MKLHDLFVESKLNEISMLGDFADLESERLIQKIMDNASDDFVYVTNIGSFEVYAEQLMWPLSKYTAIKQYVVFYFSDSWGNPVGAVELAFWDSKTYRVANIQLRKTVQGQGLGFGFYKFILDSGFNLVSDLDHTVGSRALWSKLAKTHAVYTMLYHDHVPTYSRVIDTTAAYTQHLRLIARGKNAKLPQEYEAVVIEQDIFLEK